MVNIDGGISLLNQATGYAVIITLAVFFAGLIILAVVLMKRFLNEDSAKSEMFMVANRSVGRGLTSSAVFSSWMWINETVFCAAMTYRYGIAVPLWWGSGLCFQIALMAVLGIQAKLKVPFAHTSLEIIRMRYGKIAHLVFACLNLINNISGCSNMILSGSQLLIGITGMNYVAATILLPFGVIIYTVVGGLKATFLTDYLHTTIALTLVIYFTISVLTNDYIGGISGLYDKIQATADLHPISGNYQGSLITVKSIDAVMWGLTLKFGNLALVVMDTAFWQKSFASRVDATVPGYLLAAISIYAIPLGLGTVVGLTGRVIESTPYSPTYPDTFSADAVNRGYVMPYVIKGLLGSGATGGILLLLFMALTSTVSSSLIAVSSILSYDGFRTYIKPNASDKTMIRVSHLTVILYGAFISAFTILLNSVNANMTFYGYLQPVVACPGIFPLIFTIFSSRQSKAAAVISPLLGLVCGVTTWVYTAKKIYGGISMNDTSNPAPGLYGAVVSLFSPILFSIIFSIIFPSKFNWTEFLKIQAIDDSASLDEKNSTITTSGEGVLVEKKSNSPRIENLEDQSESQSESQSEFARSAFGARVARVLGVTAGENDELHVYSKQQLYEMRGWLRFALIVLAVIILITFVVWPMPLYRDYIFPKSFFTGWVVVSIIWQFEALFAVGIYPLWDGRVAIIKALRGLWSYIHKKV